MRIDRNHFTISLPFLIVFSYFLHFQLVFNPIAISSMVMLLLIVFLFYFISCKFLSSRVPVFVLFFCILLIIFLLVFFPSVWHSLYNATLDTYRQYSTLKFYPFATSFTTEEEQIIRWLILGLLALFLLSLYDCLLNICHWFHLSAFLFIVLCIPCLLHHVEQPLTILPCSLLILYLLTSRMQTSFPHALFLFFSIVICVLMAVCTLCFPKELVWEYNTNFREKTITKILTKIQNLGEPKEMDQIDLQDAGNRLYVGAIHLQVQGEPQTYYLHTFSGSNYEDNQWTLLPEHIYRDRQIDYEKILLHLDPSNEAFQQVQSEPSNQPLNAQQIVIEDYRGSNQQILPYYLCSVDTSIDPVYDAFSLRDVDQLTYAYQVWDPALYDRYQQNEYTYPDVSEDYGNFVNSYYTQLDEKERNLFTKLKLVNPRYFSLKQASLQEVSTYIQNYLSQQTDYTLSPGNLPEGEDFLTYFLTENHQGYCVHYATAATLMLRYYGFPARYVEGYRITAEDFNGNYAYVRDFHAHAWVEVYDEVLGWIPLEFTQAAPMHEEAADEDLPSDLPDTLDQPNTNQPVNPSDEQTPLNPTQVTKKTTLPSSVIIISILGSLYFIQLFIRHLLQIRRCQQANRADAVISSYHLMQRLQKNGLAIPAQALSLAQKARFSKEGITEEEKQQMLHLFEKCKQQISDLPLRRRLIIRLLYALW